MKNLIQTHKTILLAMSSVVLLVSVFSLSIINSVSVYARDAGCYVTSQGSITAANCPEADSEGNPIDPAKCYYAPGGSQGIGAFTENDCGDSSSDDGTTSSSGPAGRTGNNCSINPNNPGCENLNTVEDFGDTTDVCGKGEGMQVNLAINIGCRGDEYPAPQVNPIIDMAFAFFRFLSAGVGLVVIASIIVAGIQYSMSRGNPQAMEASIKRVTSSFIALFIYIFLFAIANFLVPGGMFF